MLRKSVALAASFTAVLSLLNLNTAGPVTFGLSAGETAADAFTLYGTLDASATDETNAQNLGSFTGDTPDEVLAGYAQQAATWPYVFVGRDDGSTAGTFYVTGDEATASTVASQAAPATVGDYTAVFDLTTYGAAGVRIGGDRNMTASDAFLVYASQVGTVTSSAGCKLIARITGGGGTAQISALVVGYPYAIVQRAAGSTAGNILAAGVASPGVTPPGTAYVQGGNAFGATGVLGLTDAQTLRLIANNTIFALSDGTTTTIGNTAGATSVVVNAGTGNIDIGTTAAARAINIGTGGAAQTVTIGSQNGTSSLTLNAGTGTIAIGPGAQVRRITIGTGNAVQTIEIGTGIAANVITIGTLTGAASLLMRAGSGGATISTSNATITLESGTGNIDIGTGAQARTINIGTGAAAQTVNIATGDAAHVINIGTGTTAQTINLGSGAANVITIGNTTDPAEIRLRVSRGVGINTTGTPNACAILEVISTTRGVRFPNMTQAQRDAISSPLAGLVIYNTDTNKLNLRVAAAWEAVTSA